MEVDELARQVGSVSTAKDQGRLVEVHGKEKNLTGRRTMPVR